MLNICNNYPRTVWATIMWYSPNCTDHGEGAGRFGDWVKKGWWRIEPGQCANVFGDDLADVNRYFCYYADTSDGVAWSGPYVRDVSNLAFEMCEGVGAVGNALAVGYRLLDIGDSDDFTLTLIP